MPPGWDVTVIVASLTANLGVADVVGESVRVAITLPWAVMFTVPTGEPAAAGARTVTVNVTG